MTVLENVVMLIATICYCYCYCVYCHCFVTMVIRFVAHKGQPKIDTLRNVYDPLLCDLSHTEHKNNHIITCKHIHTHRERDAHTLYLVLHLRSVPINAQLQWMNGTNYVRQKICSIHLLFHFILPFFIYHCLLSDLIGRMNFNGPWNYDRNLRVCLCLFFFSRIKLMVKWGTFGVLICHTTKKKKYGIIFKYKLNEIMPKTNTYSVLLGWWMYGWISIFIPTVRFFAQINNTRSCSFSTPNGPFHHRNHYDHSFDRLKHGEALLF